MFENDIKNKFYDIDSICDYFNVDNSIAYSSIIDKNKPIETTIISVLGLDKENIRKKYQHIAALDKFLYQYHFDNLEVM
ncbi:hypothetical protein L3V82_03570 [Thiotrichales bacterium 19S3-7]|nr:hypothetical protein [Thiotrichales bacterium 19S3-7]MCF6801274.1 hypothetical protein [Thiotrichales bacterium 19S3-11]